LPTYDELLNNWEMG
jgi:hypothetical protein